MRAFSFEEKKGQLDWRADSFLMMGGVFVQNRLKEGPSL